MPSTPSALPGIFAGRSLGVAVTRLAWPIIVENLFQSAISIVDLWLVAKLGAVAVAGVGTATQIIFLLVGANSAVSIGATVLVAQAIGRGDRDEADRVTRQGLVLALVLGAVGVLLAPLAPWIIAALGPGDDVVRVGGDYLHVTLLTFAVVALMLVAGACLRGAGDSRTPMVVTGGINLVNGVVAYLLIFGVAGWPGMGVIGSAWAAVIARAVGVIVLLALLARGRRRISIAGRAGWRPDPALMRRLIRLGWPAALEQIILSGGFLVYSAMVIPLGLTAYAAQRITFNLLSLSFMPGMGYGVAATTMTGQALGAHRPDLARRSSYNAAFQAGVLMTLGGILFFFAGDPLMRLFTDDPAIVEVGAFGLKVLALSQPFWAIGQVTSGSLRGGGDTRYPMWVTLAGMWLLRLPLGYLFGIMLGYGLPGVYASSLLDSACRSLLNLHRFRRAAWLRTLPAPAPAPAAVADD